MIPTSISESLRAMAGNVVETLIAILPVAFIAVCIYIIWKV